MIFIPYLWILFILEAIRFISFEWIDIYGLCGWRYSDITSSSESKMGGERMIDYSALTVLYLAKDIAKIKGVEIDIYKSNPNAIIEAGKMVVEWLNTYCNALPDQTTKDIFSFEGEEDSKVVEYCKQNADFVVKMFRLSLIKKHLSMWQFPKTQG